MKPAPPVTSARMRAPEATSPFAVALASRPVQRDGATASYSAARRGATTSGAARRRAAASARGAGARVPGDRAAAAASAARRRARRARVAHQLGQRADAGRDDRQAGGHRLGGGQAEGLGEREGTSATEASARSARARRRRRARRSGRRRPRPPRAQRSSRLSGPSPATTSGMPATRQASIATSTPFSRRQARDDERVRPASAGRGRLVGEARARTWPSTCARAPAAARRARAAARARARWARPRASACRDQPALPQRERGGVGDRLGARCRGSSAARPGSVLRPWQRVQSSPRVKHVPDRADEPVVVQVQDHARARRARRGQRAPAERSA